MRRFRVWVCSLMGFDVLQEETRDDVLRILVMIARSGLKVSQAHLWAIWDEEQRKGFERDRNFVEDVSARVGRGAD